MAIRCGVAEDLGGQRVLLGGHVAGLLEQRQVDHRRGVAHGAGVAVPVPGAADVAAALDDAHVVDAGLLEPGAGDEAGEAAADDRHRHLVVQRLPLDPLDVGVVEEVGEATGRLEVLVVAVLAQALVALGPVLARRASRSIGSATVRWWTSPSSSWATVWRSIRGTT